MTLTSSLLVLELSNDRTITEPQRPYAVVWYFIEKLSSPHSEWTYVGPGETALTPSTNQSGDAEGAEEADDVS